MNLANQDPRLSILVPSSTDVESGVGSYDSKMENRLSSSFSRSYYSNTNINRGDNKTDLEDAGYFLDSDSIRNQTLQLANQGLLAVTEEQQPIQSNFNSGGNATSSTNYLSNLSQLINDKLETVAESRNDLNQGITENNKLVEVEEDDLDESDEEDFVHDLVPSNAGTPVVHPTDSSRPISPIPINSKLSSQHNSRPPSALEHSRLLSPNSNHIYNYQSLNDKLDKNNEVSDDEDSEFKVEDVSNNFFTKVYNEVYRDLNLFDLSFWKGLAYNSVESIPAIIIGTMLNILDAVSFGIIIFPTSTAIFKNFGPDGISLCLISTVISQFISSAGGSYFGGGNAGFMIEVVPFLHIICNIIIDDLGEAGKAMVIPTAMVAFALSTIVTGLVFLALGWFKLGSLMEFFPRHILIGCIGGVGAFLLGTAMELTTKVTPTYSWSVWGSYFTLELLPLWTSSLGLAILLQLLIKWINHPLVAPIFFMAIPTVFYFVISIANFELPYLRDLGWLFPLPSPVKPWYDVYTNFDLFNTSWSTLPKVVPAIFALTFFGILHVPINVPALAVSTNVPDIDVDRELVSHGITNLASGLIGSVQNYLIYSNSVLFIRTGGTTRLSGILLGFATLVVLLIGPQIVGYIPTMLVGALIFHLGIELIKEAVYDTYGSLHFLEYTTVVIIVLTMALVGFIEGIFLGIVLACTFFVLVYSHRSPIRATSDGTKIRSTVRRLYHQRTFLESVGQQIQVMHLQGFMFFGTVHQLDRTISQVLKHHRHRTTPLRFLILDLSLVGGIDFSATDAFNRIFHRLSQSQIYLVIAGVTANSDTGRALRRAGFWSKEHRSLIQYFENFNQALEWCENTLLSTFYRLQPSFNNSVQSTNVPTAPSRISIHMGASVNYPTLEAEYSSSPRNRQLSIAANKVHQLVNETSTLVKNARQPLGLLIQAFQEIQDVSYPALHQLSQYFERLDLDRGTILWEHNDDPNAIYIVEKGLLKASLTVSNLATSTSSFQAMESILPGALVGEVTFLTNHKRTATVIVDSDVTVVWKLSREAYNKILEVGVRNPASPEATIPYLLTKLGLTYSAYDNKLYSAMALI